MICITLLLLSIGFTAYACMAVLEFRYSQSIFSRFKNSKFWNPYESYNNKWNLDHFEHIVIKRGKRQERFPGSSTVFVFVTDAWHMMQFIFLNSIILAISINIKEMPFYISFIIIRIIYGILFNLLFDRALLIKK